MNDTEQHDFDRESSESKQHERIEGNLVNEVFNNELGESAPEKIEDADEMPKEATRDWDSQADATTLSKGDVSSFPRQPYGYVPDDYLPVEAMKDQPSSERPKHHNQDLGKRGEDAAVKYLENHGYTILERNWKCFAGEADIIAECWDGFHEIHFIEVKTRTSTCTGFPEEAVDEAKRQRYEIIYEMYLREHDVGEARILFDIISLLVIRHNRAIVRMRTNVLACDLR